MDSVEPGFNSDVVHGGTTYHIQTEDWGAARPFIVTRVFHSGVIVISIKTPYESLMSSQPSVGRQAIRLGMREQHQKVLDQLVSGTLINQILK